MPYSKTPSSGIVCSLDHGPAVSGAHNTIVTARAGKDLVSSLCAGLLTIGPRFGGAIDGAAAMFSGAVDEGLSPQEFIDKMRKSRPGQPPSLFMCLFYFTIDGAAAMFSGAVDEGLSPQEFIDKMRKSKPTPLSFDAFILFYNRRSGRNVFGGGRRRPFSAGVHRQDA